jgi:hypothetical protein
MRTKKKGRKAGPTQLSRVGGAGRNMRPGLSTDEPWTSKEVGTAREIIGIR